jgi:hypothetical protein
MKDHETVLATGGQIKGLCSAAAAAVDDKTTFDAAQYMLMRKGMLNHFFSQMSRRAEALRAEERFIERVFGLKVDLSKYEVPMIPIRSLYRPELVIIPEELKSAAIFHKADELFGLVLTGEMFNKEEGRVSFDKHRHNLLSFADDCHYTMRDEVRYRWPWDGVYVDAELTKPMPRDDDDSTKFFWPQKHDKSRAVTIEEYLMLAIKTWWRGQCENKVELLEKAGGTTWCLGTTVYVPSKDGSRYMTPCHPRVRRSRVPWTRSTALEIYVAPDEKADGSQTGVRYTVRIPG